MLAQDSGRTDVLVAHFARACSQEGDDDECTERLVYPQELALSINNPFRLAWEGSYTAGTVLWGFILVAGVCAITAAAALCTLAARERGTGGWLSCGHVPPFLLML
eukprot:gene42560-50078_t